VGIDMAFKIEAKKKCQSTHDIVYDGTSIHNNEIWYRCQKCGKKDWIAPYGEFYQLSFIDKPCAAILDRAKA
jgi:hypothetical protein